MSNKKKKMTKAQAAAARREDAKPKRKPLPDSVKDSGPKDSGSKLVVMVTAISIVVVIVLSAAYAFPGLLGFGQ